MNKKGANARGTVLDAATNRDLHMVSATSDHVSEEVSQVGNPYCQSAARMYNFSLISNSDMRRLESTSEVGERGHPTPLDSSTDISLEPIPAGTVELQVCNHD